MRLAPALLLLCVLAVSCRPPTSSRTDPPSGVRPGTVSGTVWWVIDPTKAQETSANRRPASGMRITVWTAKQAGTVSMAGEPARPHYTMDKNIKALVADDTGGFTVELAPGRYFLQALAEQVVPMDTPLVVVESGKAVEVDLRVTGAV